MSEADTVQAPGPAQPTEPARPSEPATPVAPVGGPVLPPAPGVPRKPERAANPLWTLFEGLASLRLTVALLGLSMLLIFAGTLAQQTDSIYRVQQGYFHSFFAYVNLWREAAPGLPGVWIPGGYLVGGLMLANLLAAHALRFKLRRERIGIILIHLGMILLLVGELLTGLLARETNMRIGEGEAVNYSYSPRETELALTDASDPTHDRVVVVSDRALRGGEGGDALDDPALPFEVRVEDWLPHSDLHDARPGEPTRATQGAGLRLAAQELAPLPGVGQSDVDLPSALVTLRARDGRVLGTWLVSTLLQFQPAFQPAQEVVVDGKTWGLALRFRRFYEPYWLALSDFRFDRYTGTEVARNFSSDVRLFDPVRHEDREVRIWMNNPLRYDGATFYQSSFDPSERGTVLQVVRNPAWTMPYLAVAIGALGLVVHFGATLVRFLRRQARREQAA